MSTLLITSVGVLTACWLVGGSHFRIFFLKTLLLPNCHRLNSLEIDFEIEISMLSVLGKCYRKRGNHIGQRKKLK
jgi:hypothetical protein